MGAGKGKFLVQEGRPEGKGEWDFQLDEVEDDHIKQVPEEREGGQGVNVEPTVVSCLCLLALCWLALFVKQSFDCLL